MKVLIIKCGAAGDVLRTTPLLHVLGEKEVTWISSLENISLLSGTNARVIAFQAQQEIIEDRYDLVINLEDSLGAAILCAALETERTFGAYLGKKGIISYTQDAREWFDMSLISVYGLAQANAKKLSNRKSCQQIIFSGLGYEFASQPYILPQTQPSPLEGDIALSSRCGKTWPAKNWAFYRELKSLLESEGLKTNWLPKRVSVLEHIADIRAHKLLVSGDSLPMHIALGSNIPCVSLFTCTSPWEIHGYGIQTQVVSEKLAEGFYDRRPNQELTRSIPIRTVFEAVISRFQSIKEG